MTLIARRFDFRISCELSDVIEHRHKTNKKCQQISQRGKRDMYVSDSYIEWNVLFSIVDFIIWQSSNSRLLVWILTLKNEEFFMSASLHSLSLLGSFDLCSFSLLQCQSLFFHFAFQIRDAEMNFFKWPRYLETSVSVVVDQRPPVVWSIQYHVWIYQSTVITVWYHQQSWYFWLNLYA